MANVDGGDVAVNDGWNSIAMEKKRWGANTVVVGEEDT